MAQHRVPVLRSQRGALVAGAVLVLAVGSAIGVLSAGYPDLVVPIALGVLVAGIAAVDLALLPVLAIPSTLIVARVGGILSVSDLVLAGATIVALLMLRGRGAMSIQPLLWAGGTYLALVIPTLVLNPYGANVVEWIHEIFLVLGSIIVGFIVGREGKARLALSIYAIVCSIIGILAVGVALTNGFQPVYLGDLHKNMVGGMLAAALVIAFARPLWLGWSRRWAYTAVALCGLGILASQSRQGMIGALVGVLIVSLRPRIHGGRRGKFIWFLAIPVVAFIVYQVNGQLASGNQFNSAHQRLAWFDQSIAIWQTSPVFGVGLRWWYTSRFGDGFQPPNAEFEVLTTAGIVGLVGFFAMFAAAAWMLAKLDPIYGTVGLAVIATRFAQAQFDLYWVAGQASLLWIVAGICYGVQAYDKARASDPGAPVTALAHNGSRFR